MAFLKLKQIDPLPQLPDIPIYGIGGKYYGSFSYLVLMDLLIKRCVSSDGFNLALFQPYIEVYWLVYGSTEKMSLPVVMKYIDWNNPALVVVFIENTYPNWYRNMFIELVNNNSGINFLGKWYKHCGLALVRCSQSRYDYIYIQHSDIPNGWIQEGDKLIDREDLWESPEMACLNNKKINMHELPPSPNIKINGSGPDYENYGSYNCKVLNDLRYECYLGPNGFNLFQPNVDVSWIVNGTEHIYLHNAINDIDWNNPTLQVIFKDKQSHLYQAPVRRKCNRINLRKWYEHYGLALVRHIKWDKCFYILHTEIPNGWIQDARDIWNNPEMTI